MRLAVSKNCNPGRVCSEFAEKFGAMFFRGVDREGRIQRRAHFFQKKSAFQKLEDLLLARRQLHRCFRHLPDPTGIPPRRSISDTKRANRAPVSKKESIREGWRSS